MPRQPQHIGGPFPALVLELRVGRIAQRRRARTRESIGEEVPREGRIEWPDGAATPARWIAAESWTELARRRGAAEWWQAASTCCWTSPCR
eukprot:2949655-Pyramimonas_sp.AAC.1